MGNWCGVAGELSVSRQQDIRLWVGPGVGLNGIQYIAKVSSGE